MSKINILALLAIITVSSCNTISKTKKVEHSNRIGFFDESNMNLCVLNEKNGTIDTLVHIEDPYSGLFRKTVWSPDGKHFAFTGTVEGIKGTYIADSNGKNRKLILKPKGNTDEGVLEWHKDLDLIFVMKNLDDNAEIYSVKDSLHIKNLTKLPSWDFFPALFPDGRISFVSNVDEKGDPREHKFENVYVMNPDGNGYKFLLAMEGMSQESMGSTGIFPDISPDGKLMCFTLNRDIYTIGTDGKNMKNITNTPNLKELTPSFSLDGKWVLYSGADNAKTDKNSKSPNMNLYRLNLTTNEKKQLTFGENYFTHPLYQPSSN